jgi:hypothetical protein
MALTGNSFTAKYEGHTIELVRNNWNKTLKLVIDGEDVARESCLLPGRLTLRGALEHNGGAHAVVATSIPRRFVFIKETIAVDGSELPITSAHPRGLFKAALTAAGEGHLPSIILVVAIVFILLVLLAVTVGIIRS